MIQDGRREPRLVSNAIDLLVVGLAAGSVASIAGCTSEQVTAVTVASVRVTPSTVNAVEGQRHELSALVVDDQGESLPGAVVQWSSDDPTVATVDSTGTVEARSAGTVEIRATFHGVWGSALVRVLPDKALAVSPDSVAMVTGPAGSAPPSEVVYVTNAGVSELDGLTVSVRYPASTSDRWLSAELASSTAPTTITLDADPNPLALGVHRATVVLAADDVDNSPVEIPVTLTVRLLGATADESGGA